MPWGKLLGNAIVDADVPFEVDAWLVAEQISIEVVAPSFLDGATGQHVRHPGVVGGVMVDGLSQWDRLIRARHIEQRRKLGLPLISRICPYTCTAARSASTKTSASEITATPYRREAIEPSLGCLADRYHLSQRTIIQ